MKKASIGFGKLFAPTVAIPSFHFLVALTCEQNLGLCHFDIEQTFVKSDLDEDVFMRLQRGCGRLFGMIVKLNNSSLYGLKQASRQWHARLTRCFLFWRLLQCLPDAYVFR